MHISRRHLLAASTLVPVAACGVFTTNTTNGVTTISVDVAKIDGWAQAFQNAGNLVLALPGVPALLGPAAPIVTATIAMVAADIAAFDKSAGGSVVLTFNAGSVPAAISSVLADGQKLLSTIQAALPSTAIVGTVATYVNALATIVSVFEAAIGLPVAKLSAASMSEAQALAALRVK